MMTQGDHSQTVASGGNIVSADVESGPNVCPMNRRRIDCKNLHANNDALETNKSTCQSCKKCQDISEEINSLRGNLENLAKLVHKLVNETAKENDSIKNTNAKLALEIKSLKEANASLENELASFKNSTSINGSHGCSAGEKLTGISLLIGCGLIRNIDEGKLERTHVICMPGAYVGQIRHKLDCLHSQGRGYDHIYIVMGGEDASLSADKVNLEGTLGEFKKAIETATSMSQSVTIASIPPRRGPSTVLENICKLNAHVLNLCKEKNVTFAKNNQHFFTSDGQVNDGYLVDGTHLTIKGANKLAQSLGLASKNGYSMSSRKPKQTKCYDHKTSAADTTTKKQQGFSHVFWNTARAVSKLKNSKPDGNGLSKGNAPTNLTMTMPHRSHSAEAKRQGMRARSGAFSQRAPPNLTPQPRGPAIMQGSFPISTEAHGPLACGIFQPGRRRGKSLPADVTPLGKDDRYCLLTWWRKQIFSQAWWLS